MSVGSPDLLVEAESAAEAGFGLVAGDVVARSPGALFWRRFRADGVAVVSLGLILALVLAAIFAPLIDHLVGAPGPNVQNTHALDQQSGTPTGPSPHAVLPFVLLVAGAVLAIVASALPRRLRRPVQVGLCLAGLGAAVVTA